MREKSLKKNAVLNAFKQVCTIIFPFITFTYSSHVLGNQKVGMYSFSQSVISYFALIAALGVSDYAIREVAIIRDDKKKVDKFASEVFSLNLISTIIAYCLLFILLSVWGRLNPYRYLILILSVQLILTTVGTDWINTAYEDFFYLTVRYIVLEIIGVAAMLILVKGPEDLLIYTLISMFSTSGGNLLNIGYVRRYAHIRPTLHLNLREHLKPILTLFCNSIALTIYLNSDITILGILKDDATVGIYSISTKIYLMIKALINAIIMVAVPRLSNIIARDEKAQYSKTASEIANVLFLLIIPVSVGIFFEAPNIIYLVGGEGYLLGINALRIYSFTIVFAVLSCFMSYAVLIPFHNEIYFMISTFIAAGINIGLNFVLIPIISLNGAALTTLLAEATVVTISGFRAKKLSQIMLDKRCILTELVGAGFIACICIGVKHIINGYIQELFISMIFSVIAYCIVLFTLKNRCFLNLVNPFLLKLKNKG